MRKLFILPLLLMTQLACAQMPDQVIKKNATTITVVGTTSKDITVADAQDQIAQKKNQIQGLQAQIDKLNNDILVLNQQFQSVGIDPTQAAIVQPVSP